MFDRSATAGACSKIMFSAGRSLSDIVSGLIVAAANSRLKPPGVLWSPPLCPSRHPPLTVAACLSRAARRILSPWGASRNTDRFPPGLLQQTGPAENAGLFVGGYMSENPSDQRSDRSWIVGRLADCIDQTLEKSEETRQIIAPLAGRGGTMNRHSKAFSRTQQLFRRTVRERRKEAV
jgi:hypothetical protein